MPTPLLASADGRLIEAVQGFLYDEAKTLGDEIVVEVYPPSARLPACEAPEPFLPRSGEKMMGRVSVGVRCGEDGRQVRYLQAEIGVIGSYPVLASDIDVGTTLATEHLEARRGNLAELPRRTILDSEELVGKMTTRPLRAGEALQEHQVRERPLVERNQRVTVVARGNAFRVSREGRALEPGAMGDEVRVRFGSRETLTAVVSGEATLSVDF
ncbi:flagellar basal body P-ring formation chaperone FlgA [Billgrantia gudaonensis]|uniref:flagellar basal body P-ring formation chaperone FlgA n=1 Tax=Billgrantia gudaonensis TaxID=376427 RepID=UPI001FE0674E|nr:flagellar basal body P-ring formation chaperone FlgA [Halomonas gudaonensis]